LRNADLLKALKTLLLLDKYHNGSSKNCIYHLNLGILNHARIQKQVFGRSIVT